MLDIETLRLIWWMLLGILLIAFAITDGFDLGMAVLFPFIAKSDQERRIILNTIGAVWEGNQVWIITAAGAIFAAWPLVYSVAFSSLYFMILLLLLSMGISRPVSFKYRSKIKNEWWRRLWDRVVFFGGLIPSFLFGFLIGNILQGLPFQFDNELHVTYYGSLLALFNPFACWCGLTSLVLLMMHGSLYLALRTEDPLYSRAQRLAPRLALMLMVLFVLGGFWVSQLMGYEATGVNPSGFSTPLNKIVRSAPGLWLQNYWRYPLAAIAPVSGVIAPLGVFMAAKAHRIRWAFIFSSLTIFSMVATVGVTMFPFIVPSSLSGVSSLLVWDASSTQLTLYVMLIASIIFIPLIMSYTSWVYYVLRGKVTAHDISLEG